MDEHTEEALKVLTKNCQDLTARVERLERDNIKLNNSADLRPTETTLRRPLSIREMISGLTE